MGGEHLDRQLVLLGKYAVVPVVLANIALGVRGKGRDFGVGLEGGSGS
jgi:hypothetical protein